MKIDAIGNGIALKSELEYPTMKALYDKFVDEEAKYLESSSKFRPSEYKWPSSALHNWSRIWEYPYVFSALSNRVGAASGSRVLDFGAGVTFFPLSISKLDGVEKLYLVDNDPVCCEGNASASSFFEAAGGNKIESILTKSGADINVPTESIDAIYSISVLEHLDNYEEILKEFNRILVPGGELILTFDIDLRGDFSLSINQFNRLFAAIDGLFVEKNPRKNYHPLEMLTTLNSQVQSEKRSPIGRLKGISKDLIMGTYRRNFSDYKLYLGCYGGVFTRK